MSASITPPVVVSPSVKPPVNADPLDTCTPCIPTDLPDNLRKWKRGHVRKYLEANMDEYDIEQDIIDLVWNNHISGRHFTSMTVGILVADYQLPRGAATSIQELFTTVAIPQGKFPLTLMVVFSS